tara:strand:+ start:594 stop:875 length:282 start_codon:yes stop_codon:yes gene_type:complete
MTKLEDSELINHVLKWLSHHVDDMETFRLQHSYAVEFLAMGHGWCEFDLDLWDGTTLGVECWIDRQDTELTFTNRDENLSRPELTFLDVVKFS